MNKLRNILKQILIIYFAIAVPTTVLYMSLDMIRGRSFEWSEFLLFSVVVCFSFSVFFINWLPFKKLFDNKAYDNESADNSVVCKIAQVTSNTTRNDLILKLKASRYFAKAKILEVDGKIRIITGISFKTWGEIINISISESDGKNQYNIVSMPKQQLTLIDFGSNKKNIKKIESMLVRS